MSSKALLVALCVFLSLCNCHIAYSIEDYHGDYPGGCKTIVVDKNGDGDYSSIQDAIDSVSEHNGQWTIIDIKPGTYSERVTIPRKKPYIMLKGSGYDQTKIVAEGHKSIQDSTFTSEADNFVAYGITFENSYNYKLNGKRLPAVAAQIKGDKSAFYKCRFLGVQDTIWDSLGRHYFEGCIIEGSVDFIFGNGQSIYKGCLINVLEDGYITAHGRNNPDDSTGFVFTKCTVKGSGSTYLGRPWRRYARVLFDQCSLSDVVRPEGWNAGIYAGDENELSFSEFKNEGSGASTYERVPWLKRLGHEEANELSSLSFIDADEWLEQQRYAEESCSRRP